MKVKGVCPACSGDCLTDPDAHNYTYFCKRCSIEIHEVLGGSPPNVLTRNSDPLNGDGFPLKNQPRWVKGADLIIQKYSGKRSANTTTGSSGCKCTKCQEFFPYADPVPNFICYGCKH